MARVKYSVARRKRKKKILKMAKGQWGDRSKRFRHAKESLLHSLSYATRDRRARKRDFRKLWIVRINAACKKCGLSYNRFIQGLKEAKVKIDRKMLAELAVNDSSAFGKLAEIAKRCM